MPVRLILAGAAINAVAYVQAIALLRSDIFDVYRFWAVGSLAGHSWPPPRRLCRRWPAAGLALARPLNLLALGGGMARALGLSAGRHRLAGLLCMAVLAAAAAAPAARSPRRAGRAAWRAARRPRPALAAGVLPAAWPDPDAGRRHPGAAAARAAELLTGVVVAFIGAPFLLAALCRDQGGSMSASAHDACGAMRARVDAAPMLRAGRWLAVPLPPRAWPMARR